MYLFPFWGRKMYLLMVILANYVLNWPKKEFDILGGIGQENFALICFREGTCTGGAGENKCTDFKNIHLWSWLPEIVKKQHFFIFYNIG
jgi:hypothetical protein